MSTSFTDADVLAIVERAEREASDRAMFADIGDHARQELLMAWEALGLLLRKVDAGDGRSNPLVLMGYLGQAVEHFEAGLQGIRDIGTIAISIGETDR